MVSRRRRVGMPSVSCGHSAGGGRYTVDARVGQRVIEQFNRALLEYWMLAVEPRDDSRAGECVAQLVDDVANGADSCGVSGCRRGAVVS